MMKKNILGITDFPVGVDIALLLVRLVVGIAFMHHGYGKIQHPMTWMGPESTYPGIFQALSAVSEFIGGAALALGFLTRIATFGMICNMSVAVHLHMVNLGDPFVNSTGGGSYELALVYLVIGVLFLLAGPGRFSLDKFIFWKK
jgi:putative oxidoreductase